MKIICPKCNKSVPVKYVELKDRIAECNNCEIIFLYQSQLVGAAKKNKKDLLLPKGLKLEDDGTQLIIQRKWFSLKSIGLGLIALICWGTGKSYISSLFKFDIDTISQTEFFLPALLGSAFLLYGIWLTYYAIAFFLNNTVIIVTPSALSIYHGPLPWPGNKDGPSTEIQQLYVKVLRRRARKGRGMYYTYALRLISNKGRDIDLIGEIYEEEQANFIEHAIEKYLKINDKNVSGQN